MSRHEFYHSRFSDLLDFDEAFRLRRKIEDEQSYFQGVYTYEAVAIALGNAFRAKGAKPSSYRDKPILQQVEEQQRLLNPTEDEKAKYTADLFKMLGKMQEKFERTHSGE